MATFTPPVALDNPPVLPDTTGVQYRLFRYYGGQPRGRTVIRVAGVYSTVDNPTQDLLDTATEVYLGGHVYTISATVATALTVAGYGAYVS